MSEPTNQNGWPSCSVIIPTRDALEYLRPCVQSVLDSDYPGQLQLILVDNGSQDPETLEYLQATSEHDSVTLIRIDEPFNFSRLNNLAVEQSSADVLCFLNNDIVIDEPEWLQHLVPVAARPEVGAVGPVLLYPDRTVQNGGVTLDEDHVARHSGVGASYEVLREQHVTTQCHPADALTAAAMLTRRSVFHETGGFDEKELPVSFNDIDYCLRLQRAGLLILLCPDVALTHHESVSRRSDDAPENRPRAEAERQVMQSRWEAQLLAWHHTDGVPWRRRTGDAQQDQPLSLDEVIKESLDCTRRLGSTRHLQSRNNPWEQRFHALESACSRRFLELETRHRHEIQTLESRLQQEQDTAAARDEALRLKDDELRQRDAMLDNQRAQLEAVHRSTSWRITRPLRWLSTLGRRGMAALLRTALGRRLYQRLRPQHQPWTTPQETTSPEAVKTRYSEHYRGELARFLDSGEMLQFRDDGEPEISIILILYNQAHLTLQCLLSLRDHCDTPAEIIIVDNASADETDTLLSRLSGPVRIIRNETNRGFVEAVNQGAEIAGGELLLLLNNDAIVHPGAIESAAMHFGADSPAGAVGGRIILLDGTLQEAGSIIWNDGSCAGYGRGDHPERPDYMFTREVDYCSGAFLMTPTRLFRQLGGFDMDYAPAYYEETDYCIRLQKAGFRIIYEPRATITHYEFASSGGFDKASALQQQHREVLCGKHADYLSSRMAPTQDPRELLSARSSSTRQRVLVIDDRVPDPAMGSGYPRANDIIHQLTGFDLDVTHYPLTCPEEDWKNVYRLIPATVETMIRCGIAGLDEFLLARSSHYDAILISREHNMRLFNEALARTGVTFDTTRIVYDAEALTAIREAHRLRLEGREVTDAAEQEMVADEVRLGATADVVITVNDREAQHFQQTGSRTAVLGHCMPLQLTPNDFHQRDGFLFVGALRENESPNVDSILWFVNEILPRIEDMMERPPPVYVVGDSTASALQAIDNPNVRLMGRQPDLTGYYNRCRVFIAPTRFAAGIPHKIHEAAARGIPVCATGLLGDQLGWEHGRELLVSSDAASFAAQCVWLYEDNELWHSVRDHAAGAMQAECSEAAFRERLREIIMGTPRDTGSTS